MATEAVVPIIRPRAQVLRVHDADTFLMLLDLHGAGLGENGCVTEWIRLRDYSARELDDVAAVDPKGFGRVNGPTAKTIAEHVLAQASDVLVELLGPDTTETTAGASFGRYVGWVWVDGQSLGQLLAAQHAVVAGKFEGTERAR